jgi:hypothetical protein
MNYPPDRIDYGAKSNVKTAQIAVRIDDRIHAALLSEVAQHGGTLADAARQHIARSLFGDPATHQLAEIKVMVANLALAQESMRSIDLREARDAIERRLVDLNRLSTITAEQITSYSKMTLSGLRKLKEAFTELHKIVLSIRK